jgi:predicted nucleic acid-binding protein
MDRLFLDANILFSAAYRPDAGLLWLWKVRASVLCSSRCAFEEAKVNLTEGHQKQRLARLAQNVQWFDAAPRQLPGSVSLPEKDRPILLAAIEARATHLITGDVRHFGPYFGKRIEGILIVTPAQYLKIRKLDKT